MVVDFMVHVATVNFCLQQWKNYQNLTVFVKKIMFKRVQSFYSHCIRDYSRFTIHVLWVYKCVHICSRDSQIVSFSHCCHSCGSSLCQYFCCRTLAFQTDDFHLCCAVTQFQLLPTFCSASLTAISALSPWCTDHSEYLRSVKSQL